MSVVVINAVTVPDEDRGQFEARFADRAGKVSAAPGLRAAAARPGPPVPRVHALAVPAGLRVVDALHLFSGRPQAAPRRPRLEQE